MQHQCTAGSASALTKSSYSLPLHDMAYAWCTRVMCKSVCISTCLLDNLDMACLLSQAALAGAPWLLLVHRLGITQHLENAVVVCWYRRSLHIGIFDCQACRFLQDIDKYEHAEQWPWLCHAACLRIDCSSALR